MSYYMKEPIFRGPIVLCPQCKSMGIRKLLKNCAKHSAKQSPNKNHRNLSSHSQSKQHHSINHYGASTFVNDYKESDNYSEYMPSYNYNHNQNSYPKHNTNYSHNTHNKYNPQRHYNNNNSHNMNKSKSRKCPFPMQRCAPSTIDLAEAIGIYTNDQIGYLKATKNSKDKEDVQAHRSVQYVIKKGLEPDMKWSDFPYGKENCAAVHGKYKMNRKDRHKIDDPENMPGLSELLFPDDPEMAEGFKEWVNEYDRLEDIEDSFDEE